MIVSYILYHSFSYIFFVVSMLSSNIELSKPKQPDFFVDRKTQEPDSSSSQYFNISLSERLTIQYIAPHS